MKPLPGTPIIDWVAEYERNQATIKALTEALQLPPQLEQQYEAAADKAFEAGALKSLRNAEAAIGAWFIASYRNGKLEAALALAKAGQP